MIECDPRSARNMLSGYWPGARHWRAIVRQFGQDVLDAVFGPDIDDTLAREKAEIARLENELANRKARLRAVAGAAPGVAETSVR